MAFEKFEDKIKDQRAWVSKTERDELDLMLRLNRLGISLTEPTSAKELIARHKQLVARINELVRDNAALVEANERLLKLAPDFGINVK